MKIGIVGAGFTGLAAGFKLSKKGHEVIIFEQNNIPGGLAIGFDNPKWKWSLESHYHHLFKTDYAIQALALDVKHKIEFRRPITSVFYKDTIKQIDSPMNLLKFEHLSFFSRVRCGIVLAYLKITNYWQPLEKTGTFDFLIRTMGRESWDVLWKPLMNKKFGRFSKVIPASWFWARVKSRTASLGYPRGGFKALAKTIADRIVKQKGKIIYNVRVESISKKGKKIIIKTSDNKTYEFDKVICTLPTPLFIKITKGLPKKYLRSIKPLVGIGASNLVLSLRSKFFEDGTYWLNINEMEFPFLCIVEHTNFMDSKNYDKDKIIYVGNYLETTHKYFSFSEKELIEEYFPYLEKINKNFKKSWIKKAWLFKAPFAQPIVTKGYSKKIPPVTTPIDGLYLANIQQVYPWDRGTNYAVDLGNKVAGIILND